MAIPTSAYIPRHQAVMVQARTEVVRELTTWPSTNHGWRFTNTAALITTGAASAIQLTAANRSAPTHPSANTPPIRATRMKSVAIAMQLRKVMAEESA